MTATELQRENEGLRHRLAEAEDALRAIRQGKVDAIVVEGEEGTQVFSLSGAESIYRRAVETMGEGVLNLAPDGTVQFCNRRFAQLLNTPEERLIGHHLQEWVAPEHHEAFLEFLQRCGREETRRRVQFVAPVDAPRRRPLLLTGTPLGSDGGFCVVAADLHELESSAYQIEALRHSEAQLRHRIGHLDLLAQVSARLIFNHRTELETLEEAFGAVGQAIGAEIYIHYQPRDEVGMRLCAWGGLTEDERTKFATMPYGELLCGRVAARREKLIVENIAHTTVEGSEAARAAGYGAYAGFPLVDGEELLGTVAFITRAKTHFLDGEVSLIQTISDLVAAMLQRSRLMRRLKESEERHRLALEGGDLGSWDVNLRTGEAVWNRRHAELQGYDPENELTTYERWRQRLHPDDVDWVLAEINQSAAFRQPVALEHRISRADTGETRWLSLFGRFRYGEGGEAIRFSGVSREITRRKEMEAALRESEELARQRLAELEDIYRNAPVGLGVLDADLQFVRINERLAEINGIPAADHLGRSVRELLPHLADFAEPILREVLTTGEPKLNLEITGETPAAPGVQRSWLEHWLPVKDAEGKTAGISIVAEETTERNRAERALRESQNLLRLATSAAELGVFAWDVARDTSRWENDRIYEIFGRPREQGPLSRAEFCSQGLLSEDLTAFTAALNEAMSPGGLFRPICRIRRWNDGQIRWIEFSGRFEFDQNGAAVRLIGVVADITARKQAEEKIRRQAELLDRVSDAIVATDPGLHITSWNQAAERIYGWMSEEVIGRQVDDLLQTRFPGTTREEAERQLAMDGYVQVSAIHQDRSREEHHIESNVVLLRDERGQPAGTLGVLRDVTARKRAEAELERALQQTKLLFSEVHHRVKNNLQILSSLINLQAEDLRAAKHDQPAPVTPEALFSAFTDLRDRVRSMALVHEKLYRSESLSSLEFSDYIRSLLPALWRAHQPGEAIELVTNLSPVRITLDQAVPCGLILNELTVNALTHAFRGRTQGTVRVAVSGDAPQIRLLVADDGVGLPPETNWREGRSLGLRLVQLLTRQLEGTVELHRPETGGSEFAVTFPAAFETQPAQP